MNSADGTLAALKLTLDRTSRKTAVTVSNLANVDTPGYRALQVEFQDAFRNASAFSTADNVGTIREAPITRMRPDGNTVDIDQEMTHLAQLQGRFTAVTQMVRKRFALLRYAATDGRQ